jgi:hypothetical protein
MSYQTTYGNNQNPQQKNEKNVTQKQSPCDPKKSGNKPNNDQGNSSARNQKDSGKMNRG